MSKRVEPLALGPVAAEVVEVWATVGNTDMTEGRGSPVDLRYYGARADALVGAKGAGVFGSDADVARRQAVRIGDRYCIVDRVVSLQPSAAARKAREDLRARTLAKLSAAEREALGLGDA
jgi:hypothetical protein